MPCTSRSRAAQHSQALYSLFTHIPGLKVVAPSNPVDAKGLLAASIQDDHSVVFFWYRSGDLVRWDPSGNFVVTGRVRDLINRGGEKISALEVGSIVDVLPQVRRSCAIALPDPEYGELACLCVVLYADFPLTAVGKVDKKTLRAEVLGRATDRAA